MADYLGDGVYVGHDGYQIWLVTSDGENVQNKVALDAGTLRNFDEWRKRLELKCKS